MIAAHPRMSFVFMSPHFDDIVLSCAVSIMKLLENGHVCRVVTVCGGDPETGVRIGEVARQYLAEDLGLAPDTAITGAHVRQWLEQRKREDREALRLIEVRDFHLLTVPDAIYRGGQNLYYDKEAHLFGTPRPEDEQAVVGEVTRYALSFDADRKWCWVFPAVSAHVDHRILKRAGLALRNLGFTVVFYADFPYWRESVAFPHAGWTRVDLWDGKYGNRKKTAIMAYRSQLTGLFGTSSPEEVAGKLSALEMFWVCNTRQDLIHLLRSL